MKHLMIDCRMIRVTGIGNYMSHMIPGLVLSGKFQITCLGNVEVLQSFPWAASVRLLAFDYKIFSPMEQLGFLFKLPPCDVIWFPQYHSPFFPLRAKKRVTTVHDVMQFRLRHLYSGLARTYLGLYLKNALKRSDTIITVSEFTKSELQTLFSVPAAKIRPIHLAVDADYAEGVLRQPGTRKYVLYVGNVRPHKNLLMALQAFQQSDLSDHSFYIVGNREGFYSGDDAITGAIDDLGDRVHFTGYVSDAALKSYYANAALFLFPSKYEGFGLPLLEAMTFNIPILSSSAASLKEVGGNAIPYFNADDAAQLVKLLNQFAAGKLLFDYDKYSENLKRFDWSKTIQQHITLLSE